ncbi:hypothetical protein Cabys_2392 [Caldithrix abyssi DSM 13497]|uniref:Uncharacterized protein n=1 Tax=Caldithrix abyssi DSM 13497 TaxID=880073 RepID=A0A1J1C8W3_CALAY|nr:hypothetical protein Cabys_2392 [Caldithrix abyssi DSM 13497]
MLLFPVFFESLTNVLKYKKIPDQASSAAGCSLKIGCKLSGVKKIKLIF